MKNLLTLLLLWPILVMGAQTDLKVNLTDFTLSPATNRTVYVQALTVPTASSSSTVIGSRVTYTTDTNGIFYISNVLNNVLYNFDVQAPPSRTVFMVWIKDTDTGLISAWSNMTASSTATFPAGSVAWSAASSDLRYARAGQLFATNVVWPVAGTNTFLVTNGFGVQINVTNSGFVGNANQFNQNANTENQIKSGSLQSNNTFYSTSGNITFKGSGGQNTLLLTPANGAVFPLGLLASSALLTNGAGTTMVDLEGADGSATLKGGITGTGTSNYLSGSLVLSSNLIFTPVSIVLSTNDGDPSLIIGTNPPVGINYTLMPGTYVCSNWFRIPTNGSIVGYGAILDNRVWTGAGGYVTPLIAPSDNSRLIGVTVTNIEGEAKPGGATLGADFWSVTYAHVGQAGFTNFEGRDLTLLGGSDNVYFRHTNNFQGTFWNCKINNGWDILGWFNNGDYKFDFHGCTFVHFSSQTHIPPLSASTCSMANGSTTLIRFFDCDFTENNTVVGSPAFYLVRAADGTGQQVEFHNCTLTNVSNSPQPLIGYISGGSTYPIIDNCNFPANIVGIDDASRFTAKYDPVITTNITFGGNTEEIGPQIYATATLALRTLNIDATSNNFNGIVKAANLAAGTMTNLASAGNRVQITDAGGKVKDTTATVSTAVAGDGSPIIFGAGLVLSGGTLSAATGSQSPWSSDINGAQFSLTNAFSLTASNIVVSNATPSRIARISSANTVTNATAANSATTLVAGDGSGVTAGSGITISGGSISSGGSDATAWHNTGDNYAGAFILGPTNGTDWQWRMQINGAAGATIGSFRSIANNDSLSWQVGTSNSLNGTAFNGLIFGYHNSVGPLTDSTIAGGAFNQIGGSGNQAFIAGGRSNIALGNYSFAAGQAATAANDNSFVWNGIPNRIVSAPGNGGVVFGVSNTGLWITNGNDATINGVSVNYGSGIWSSNTAAIRNATYMLTNSGNMTLFYMGTNSPSAGHENKITSGVLASNKLFMVDAPTQPDALTILTNGDVRIGRLSASKVVLTDANTNLASAAASGAVPINADGSATGIGTGLSVSSGTLNGNVSYTLPITTVSSGNPVNGTTYYFGMASLSTTVTTYGQASVKIPKTGTLKGAYIKVSITTPGTGETVTSAIRINDTTDVSLPSSTWNATPVDITTTSLSQSVTAGDTFVLKVVCPTWVTPPVGIRLLGYIYIE